MRQSHPEVGSCADASEALCSGSHCGGLYRTWSPATDDTTTPLVVDFRWADEGPCPSHPPGPCRSRAGCQAHRPGEMATAVVRRRHPLVRGLDRIVPVRRSAVDPGCAPDERKRGIECANPLLVGLFGRYSRIANLIEPADCLNRGLRVDRRQVFCRALFLARSIGRTAAGHPRSGSCFPAESFFHRRAHGGILLDHYTVKAAPFGGDPGGAGAAEGIKDAPAPRAKQDADVLN
jgi:hypothetical protein